MPIVQMSILEGRSAEQKENLITEVTQAVQRVLGVPADAVRVLINEVPHSHWGVGGESKAKLTAGSSGNE